jgi:serine/threonine protein kinase
MTQFYMAEMVLCVEEIHRMKWIHRDVKPDNFLLSSSGHLKVSDFGLAFDGHWAHNQKYHNETRYSIADRLGIRIRGDDRDSEEARAERLGLQANPPVKAPRVEELQRPEGNLLLDSLNAQWKRRLARTIVGTSQYMAPEVIQGLRYDGRCDWWSIGIILYECLYGRTPFLSETREETKLKIAHYVPPLAFPAIQRRQSLPGNRYILLPPVSGDANALINALISPRESRLSARKYRDNDAQHSRSSRRAAAGNGNGTGGGGGAHADFVFENDAKDIKRHAFFRGVDWDTMHAQVPPFIPRIREDQSITKYFEDEKDILGSGSESATSVDYSECVPIAPYDDADVPTRVAAALPRIFAAGADPRGSTSVVEALVARAGERGEGHGTNNEEARFALEWLAKQDARAMKALWKRRRGAVQQQQADGKGKKAAGAPPATRQRPRDKILRDPKMYRTAMHVRKRYAFMGYTYRRPHYVRRGVGVIGGKAGSVVLGVSGQT